MIEAWQKLIISWPILQTIADALFVIIPLAALMAYTGLFFISATARIIGIARKRSAYEKCSKQLAFLGLSLGWIILVGARIWLYYTQAQRPEGSLVSYLCEISWLLLSLGVMLGTIYYFLWRFLKNMPVLHSTLGMLCAAQNCVSLACILLTIRLAAIPHESKPETVNLPNIFPEVWEAPIWSAACYTIPAIFGLASACGLCWLAIRRKKDDFGRDYYNTMLRWLAAWASNSWFILIILLILGSCLQAWHADMHDVLDLQALVYEISGILLWFIPALFWLIIKKSELPMRNRWLLYIALPLAMTFMLPYFMDITFI